MGAVRCVFCLLAIVLTASNLVTADTPFNIIERHDPPSLCPSSDKATSFLMGFIGHSGSSAIMSTLLQREEADVPFPMEPLRGVNATKLAEMTRAIFNKAISKELVPGFKVRPGNVASDLPAWSQLVREYKTRLILNYREDVFRTAIGLYAIRGLGDLSSQMGVRHESSEEHCLENPDACHFEIKDVLFLGYLMEIALRTRNLVKDLVTWLPWRCVLTVVYEDYEADSERTMSRIYNFLGLPDVRIESLFNKALPQGACDVITNYQEVCTKFWGCDVFRPYLEDPAITAPAR